MTQSETIGPIKRLLRSLGSLMAERRNRRWRRKHERLSQADMRALSAHTKRDIGWFDR